MDEKCRRKVLILLYSLVFLIILAIIIGAFPQLRNVLTVIYIISIGLYTFIFIFTIVTLPTDKLSTAIKLLLVILPLIFIVLMFIGVGNSNPEIHLSYFLFYLLSAVCSINMYVWLLLSMLIKRDIPGITDETDSLKVSKNAKFFGQASKGKFQVQGSGKLFLLRDRLIYKMYMSKKVHDISLSNIYSIEITKKHFISTRRRPPFLKINYINHDGDSDAIALALKNLEDWKKSINQAIQQ